jgi:hypothetical protein
VHFYEAAAALVAGGSSEDIARDLTRAGELLRSTAPKQAAIAATLLGELRATQGRHDLAVAAYRTAAEDARAVGDHELVTHAELGELGTAVDGGLASGEAADRLRALAERFQANGHTLHEGLARAHLGRVLLREGQREPATVELERARTSFEATTDATRALEVAKLLETSP